MAKYMDLLLVKDEKGDKFIFLAPTSKANEGDLVMLNGDLHEITKTDWINVESKTYQIFEEAGVLLIPDRILAPLWDREEAIDEQDT